MNDIDKSKEQLMKELGEMRRCVEELTATQAELSRTEEELHLLQMVIMDICRAANAQIALHDVLKRVCKATGWVYGEVWLPSSDGSFMERSPVWYSGDDCLDKFGMTSESFKFSPGIGLPGRVWSSKKPIWIKDVTQDSEYLRAEIAREVGLKTALAIPILAQDEVVAVMVFYLFKERGEDDRFVELVSAVAAQLGSIMRHKQIEDALSVSENHYRSLIESSQDCICHISLDGRFLSMNAAGYAINELDNPDDIIGKSSTEVITENRREAEDAVRRAAGGETVALQYKSSSKTGKDIWWDAKYAPVRDLDGTVTSILRISRDITERRKDEEELLFLKKAVETMQIGITLTDAAGKILYTNPAEARMHGYEVNELIGQSVRVYAPSESWNRLALKDMSEIVRTLKRESVNIRKDGSRFPVQLLSDGVVDSTGRVIGIVTCCEDITERKMLEEELIKVGKLESVSTLSGGIAHDFNNILTIILGRISLAKMHLEPGNEIFEMLGDAEKGCKRARDLTNQLLTFAKGGAPIKKTVLLPELIKETAVLALSGSNVKIEYSLQDDTKAVEADEGQMSQVINNLLLNALHAMPDGGIINVTAENAIVSKRDALPLREGEYVVISIKDHGAGIPEEYLPRIFDPFFTTKQKGSGLGLATSYSIVRKHEGHITVKSEPGSGTAFHIYLPASKKEIEAKVVREEKTIEAGGRILIMDDEEVLRESTGDLLKHLGYEVETAADGLEAIDKYKKAKDAGVPFSVVIMDLTIPGGMGGKDAVKRLLEIDHGARAIVSSGYSNDPIMADFRRFGFSGVVVKPYKIEELCETLDRVIAGK